MSEQLQRTPLFDVYASYGGKTIDFGGWELPVQFSSIKQEHEAVRTKAGLFDVSHMGEIIVKGEDSLPYLQRMLTNDLSKLQDGQAMYSAMCYEDGGTVDDLLVYKIAQNHYLLVVNASNIEKDFEWMKRYLFGDLSVINASESFAQIALQGPLAESVLQKLTKEDLSEITFFKFKNQVKIGEYEFLLSRTGYTGEDGFEIYGNPQEVKALWHEILEEGKVVGVLPCGLGARDTLRFEACLALYGQELTKDISPLEAGIGFAVKLKKEDDFIGQKALVAQKESGISRKLVGLEMIDKGIPRTGYPVFVNNVHIGEITTGTQSPTLKKNIGLGLIDRKFSDIGTEVEVEIRGKRLKAVTVATPFYKRQK